MTVTIETNKIQLNQMGGVLETNEHWESPNRNVTTWPKSLFEKVSPSPPGILHLI